MQIVAEPRRRFPPMHGDSPNRGPISQIERLYSGQAIRQRPPVPAAWQGNARNMILFRQLDLPASLTERLLQPDDNIDCFRKKTMEVT
jgi:hypothetical protein